MKYSQHAQLPQHFVGRSHEGRATMPLLGLCENYLEVTTVQVVLRSPQLFHFVIQLLLHFHEVRLLLRPYHLDQ